MIFKKAFAVMFLASSTTFVRAEFLLRSNALEESAKIEAPDSSVYDPATDEAGEEEVLEERHLASRECRMFLSSKTYRGSLGGLKAADGECQSLAEEARLETPGMWKALIYSDQETCPDYDPKLYMSNCKNGIHLVNSRGNPSGKVAANKKHLLSSRRSNYRKIDRDEHGEKVSTSNKHVWTGARRSGSKFIAADQDCYRDWEKSRGKKTGEVGRWTSRSSKFLASGKDRKCDKSAHIICIEMQYSKENKKYAACTRSKRD